MESPFLLITGLVMAVAKVAASHTSEHDAGGQHSLTIDYSPMDCQVQRKPGAAGKVVMESDWVESQDVCLSICWQLKAQGSQCDFVNYMKLQKKCQIFVASSSQPGKIVRNGVSNYVAPTKCSKTQPEPRLTQKHITLQYGPMKCEGERQADALYSDSRNAGTGLQQLLDDAVMLVTELAQSEEVCASICYQLQSQGYPCYSINYITSNDGSKCELLNIKGVDGANKLKQQKGSVFFLLRQCCKPQADPLPTARPAVTNNLEYTNPAQEQKLESPGCPHSSSATSHSAAEADEAPSQSSTPSNDRKIPRGTCGQSAFPHNLVDVGRRRRKRLAGGTDVHPHSIPSIVQIRTKTSSKAHVCAGTLVKIDKDDDSNVVVSSPKCFATFKHAHLEVAAGVHQRNNASGVETADIKNVIILGNRNGRGIAIVVLSHAIKFSDSIQPACLPERHESIKEGTIGIVAGWGAKSDTGDIEQSLKRIAVPVTDINKCKKRVPNLDPAEVLCVGDGRGGKGACIGDIGDPFLAEGKNGYTLYGIVGSDFSCGRPNQFEIYSAVAPFVSVISNPSLTNQA